MLLNDDGLGITLSQVIHNSVEVIHRKQFFAEKLWITAMTGTKWATRK